METPNSQASSGPYIPQPDEPSPFGAVTQEFVDNPWILWYRVNHYYGQDHSLKVATIREQLISRLRKGGRYTNRQLMNVPCKRSVNGEPSLGYVIHLFSIIGDKTWEQVHSYAKYMLRQEFAQST